MGAGTMVCEQCARRFTDPATLATAQCPRCQGALVPLDEDPNPDPPADG
jgi:Zn finger protein HypA/HybF involved in hydrogenase expression